MPAPIAAQAACLLERVVVPCAVVRVHAHGVAKTALLAITYVALALLGGAWTFTGSVPVVEPQIGMAVAALVLCGRSLWPGVAVGAAAAAVATGLPPLSVAVTAAGSVLEVVVTVAVIERLELRPQLDRLADVPRLAAAALTAALVGAAVEVLVRALEPPAIASDAGLVALARVTGDALSVFVLGGALLAWAAPADAPRTARPFSTTLAVAVVAATSIVLFFDPFDIRSAGESVAFPLIPVVVWMAFWLGPRGTALAAVVYAAVAIVATERGLGPFVGTNVEASLFYLDVFIAVTAVSGAGVAGVVAQRAHASRRLEDARRIADEALVRLQTLEAIGHRLAAEGATSDALDAVAGGLADVFGYEYPSIYLGGRDLVRLGAHRGYAIPVLEIGAERGVVGRVLRTGQAVYLPDVSVDPDFIRADPAIKSEIATPLLAQGELLGVLNVESRQRLDDHDLASVTVVADRVAAALALARERDRLAELAVRDALTGLHNRRYFDDALEQLLAGRWRVEPAKRQPVAAVMFDLDHFGLINLRHGHQVGDDVLRAFAELLGDRFRASDLVARYGGEEFIVVLPAATLTDAVTIAEQVRRSLAALPLLDRDGRSLHVTVSAGCASLPDDDAVGTTMIRAADTALLAAKEQGRNRVLVA